MFESFKSKNELGVFLENYELDDLNKFEDMLTSVLEVNCKDLPEVK